MMGALAGAAVIVTNSDWVAPRSHEPSMLHRVATEPSAPHDTAVDARGPTAPRSSVHGQFGDVPEGLEPDTVSGPQTIDLSPQPEPPASGTTQPGPESAPSSEAHRAARAATGLGAGGAERSRVRSSGVLSAPSGEGPASEAPVWDAPSPSAPNLVLEIQILQQARSALQAGQAGQALDVLDRHEYAFRRGALEQEARVLRISALCELHRESDARAAIDRFIALWSRSPLVKQLRGGCQGLVGNETR
jgi:hypothetical protein